MKRLNSALKGITCSFYSIAKDEQRFIAIVSDQYSSNLMPAPLSMPGKQS